MPVTAPSTPSPHIDFLPNIAQAIPSPTTTSMQTVPVTTQASSLSQDPCSSEAKENRETFSRQTLILTALTAINSPNHHPTFNEFLVNKERIQYMKDKTDHTPIIDAATKILITDTEILATMTRGVQCAHSIVAIKEMKEQYKEHDNKLETLLESGLKDLDSKASTRLARELDALLPDSDDFDWEESHNPDKDVFISFPNINSAIPIDSSSYTGDPICKPIIMNEGLWNQIMMSKNGFIFEPPG